MLTGIFMKARKLLGYEPRVSFEDGVQMMVKVNIKYLYCTRAKLNQCSGGKTEAPRNINQRKSPKRRSRKLALARLCHLHRVFPQKLL